MEDNLQVFSIIKKINAESTAKKAEEIKKRSEARRQRPVLISGRGSYDFTDNKNNTTVRKVVEEGVVSGPIESTQSPAVKTSFGNRMSAYSNRTPTIFKQQKSRTPLAKGILSEESSSYV